MPHRWEGPLAFEPLEPRLLLDGTTPVISELMAVNNSGLTDGDGDFSDWIELHNPTDGEVNLAGWYLTDDAADLTKWQFPAVTLAAEDYLVVFASDKNRTNPAELHTNFKLSSEGEYLALVQPDGTTIAHQYTPNYPQQFADISYGVTQDQLALVAEGDQLHYRVPTIEDGALGTQWTLRGFNDATWHDTVTAGGSTVRITEIDSGSPDWVEIQNVSDRSVNTTGWFVAANNNSGGVNSVHSQVWSLPGSMDAGEVLYRTDSVADHYWGSDIAWDSDHGWAMIVDGGGQIVDFLPWGYSEAEIAGLNVSVGGFSNLTLGDQWSGDSPSMMLSGWNNNNQGGDIGTAGNPSPAGSHSYNPATGVTTIQASGSDIWDTQDHFYYQYQPVSGDTEIIARVNSVSNTDGWAKAGVMIRETLDYSSKHAMVVVTPGNGVSFQRRTTTAGGSDHTPGPSVGAPYWVRLVRSGDTFTAYSSPDGNSWSQFGSVSISMASSVYVGLNVTAHNNGAVCTAEFQDVFAGEMATADALQRVGNTDDNAAGNFAATDTTSKGSQNSELTVPFADGELRPAVTGIGFPLGFADAVQTDVEAEMRGVNASHWTRIPFDVADPTSVAALKLRMKYNDGFVAYLNGTQIAHRNDPTPLEWNSQATDPRTEAESSVFEEFDATAHIGELVSGSNVLAIHGLNSSPGDGDFLVLPELLATDFQSVERYFIPATPGDPNGPGFIDFVAEPEVSVDHGFFTMPFQVVISSDTPGATIRYTLDGSEPTDTNGVDYPGPLTISSTTTLRAAAFRTDYRRSDVETQTYVFLEDVRGQSPGGQAPAGWPTGPIGGQVLDYGMDPDIVDDPVWEPQLESALASIPTMSLVTDLDNLFDPATGIYVNAHQDGADWERPTSLELIYPDGTQGFQIDAGLRIREGYTDQGANPKHAFRLFFRGEYGAGQLEYPLFGDEGVESFDKLDLRTAQDYSWSFDGSGQFTMVRDVFSRDTQAAMDQPYTRSRYYHLYINGQYWGLYQTQERSEAAYGESYFGGNREDYDVIKVSPEAGYTIAATDGNLDAWQELWNQANAGFATDAAYYRAQGLNPDGTRNPAYPVLLDVDNLVDYMLVILYTGNQDGPISALRANVDPNNFFAVRDRNGEEGFQFFVHDAEHTLSQGEENRNGPWPAGDDFLKSNPQWIHQQLMAHPEYRLRFADGAHDYLFNEGLLTPDAAAARLTARADEIAAAIIAESARWGDAQVATPLDKDDWLAAIDNEVTQFFPGRTQAVLSQLHGTTLRDGSPAPLYPDVVAPTYSQHGGQVDENFILWISAPSGVIYYTLDGSDPRLPGGGILPGARLYNATPIPVTESMVVRSRVLDGGEWSALNEAGFYVGEPAGAGNLAITELNYNPYDPTPEELLVDPTFDNDDFEFVELQNTGDVAIDLTSVEFTDGIAFNFAGGNVTRLQPGELAVVAANLAAFQARYESKINTAGQYSGNLDNGGERIVLQDRFGQPIHDFVYDDAGDWPGRADGKGSSLEVINPQGNYNDGENWHSSSEYGGSPGSHGAGPAADVVVNEVLSQPIAPDVDAIELYNTSDQPVDVGGWYLSDSSDNYRKFQIPRVPESIIPPDGYLVFDESDFNPSGGVDLNDFGLDGGDGDDVWLLAADAEGNLTRFADHVEFGEALRGVSFGRSPNGTGPLVMMTEVTLGAENGDPRIGAIVINEIHTDPDVKTELVEFIELYNASDRTVDLSGWYFSAGVSYTFPQGTEMPPGGYLVVSQDPAAVQAKFGVSSFGPFVGKLENEGERIVLRDSFGIKQDEVNYGLGFPWPVVGDPPGYSLELIHPALDNDLPGSWRASAGSVGTPQTYVYAGSQWRYFKGTQEPSSQQGAWRQIGFGDSSWLTGQAAIGYGEGFLRTPLPDMQGNYTTVYLRRTFDVPNPGALGALLLEVQYDDGINVWINGSHVAGANVLADELPYSATAINAIENQEFVPFTLSNPGSYLVTGTNVIAVQLLNASLSGSSDCFFDARLVSSAGGAGGVTPGGLNSVFALNAPPHLDEVAHTPQEPVSGEDVAITMKVTDSDGVASVSLDYQLVNPGDYINHDDPRYEDPASWTTVAMYDDGSHGDTYAGDDVYTAVLPGALQISRRLVRYRITAEDALGASVTAPYPDDPQPNFAYYVYDGVPSWTGSARPGVEPQVEYSSELLDSIPVYQLITTRQDHLDAMHVPYRSGEADQQVPTGGEYWGSEYLWQGTLVYDGVVYDHIRYRARGGVWRYSMGKNMWKFDFNKGHYFQAHDDYGNPYEVTWDKLNFSALIQQGNFEQRGEQGLFEAAGFRLHELAGNEASNTNFVTFRVVEDAGEGGPDQFSTDFQGLYLVIEQPDGRLLDQHGMPDGNFYKMEGGTGDLNNQGPTQPSDKSDLNAFMSTYQSGTPDAQWWEDNFDLDGYYSFRAIAMAIHDYDIHAGKNYFYYHNPETDAWSIHNWDLDLCWTTTYGGGGGDEPFRDRVLAFPQFRIDYNNRMREIRDLLFNPEQTGMLIDEVAQVVYTPGQPSLVDADCAMWDYNPILVSGYINSSKAGHGRFYENSPTDDFAGMVQIVKNYVASRQNAIDPTIAYDDTQAPHTPAITYVGEAGYPSDALEFQSSAFSSPGSSFAAMQWRVARVTDPTSPNFDPNQPRHYEITATWESDEITTFDGNMSIPGEDLEIGEIYRVRVRMKGNDGRWSHWSDPVQFEAGVPIGPLVDGLRITELNYNPYPPTAEELDINPNFDNDDFEFVELHNITGRTFDLTGVQFTDGIEFDFTGSGVTELGPDEYVVVAKDLTAFQARYGTSVNVAGPYSGQLKNEGERVILMDPFGRAIHDFSYDDSGSWPGRAEGMGSSLEVLDVSGDYSNPANWRASTQYGGSPGEAGDGPLSDVVVNEVLSNTTPPSSDAIELYNTTGSPIDVGGWYLSNSSDEYLKFRIPPGTSIPAHGYVVFDEGNFNPTPGNPAPNDFTLNGARGDDVWLMKADGSGKLTHFVDHVEFGAAANGESWGRWPNGVGDLYPMLIPTLDPEHPEDGENSGPRIGPVLISEVHYNPKLVEPDDDLEFVEIYNSTSQTVDLTNWRIRGGIDYDFPADTMLDAHAAVVIVPFDLSQTDILEAFRSEYGIVGQPVDILGGYARQLNDDGERVQLQHRGAESPDEPGFIPYLLEDEVVYEDGVPWSSDADGHGSSLNRVRVDAWGNAPVSWNAVLPTPGSTMLVPQEAEVVGRHVFYNHSAFDGNSAAPDAQDDGAIALDKETLLPGNTATFANYTSYSRGINGIMVDVDGLPELAAPGVDDFQFRVGNSNDPGSWAAAAAPSSITVRRGAGTGGSDRITLIWPDNAIQKQWLQVTVLATANTGLAGEDVFYFGNAIGESGNSATDAKVNATDMLAARNNQRTFINPAPIDFDYDYDRDARVNATDMLIARNNQTNFLTALNLIGVPQSKAGGEEAASIEGLSAQDAVLEQAATPKSHRLEPSTGRLAWLYEFEPTSTSRGSSEKDDSAERAVDKLLATYGQ